MEMEIKKIFKKVSKNMLQSNDGHIYPKMYFFSSFKSKSFGFWNYFSSRKIGLLVKVDFVIPIHYEIKAVLLQSHQSIIEIFTWNGPFLQNKKFTFFLLLMQYEKEEKTWKGT